MIEQFIKFCVVGGSGVFVDFGVTYLCKEFLRLNRVWTFHNENPDIAGQYLRFLGIAAIGLVINNATIYLLHNRFRLNFYLAKLFATGVVTFWNFFMNYFFTFEAASTRFIGSGMRMNAVQHIRSHKASSSHRLSCHP